MGCMVQCPSCESFTAGEDAFCSQCGAWLGGPRGRRRSRRAFRLPFLSAGLILVALAAVIAVLCLPQPRGKAPSGKESLAKKDGEPMAPVPVERDKDGEGIPSVARLTDADEPQVLDAARATRLVSQALVVLDLRGEDDRPLREVRGVIVDPAGVVLCRFRPLLGAHHGTCRLPRSEGARVEVTGLSYSVDALDLALVHLAASPEGYPSISLLEDPPPQVLRSKDAVFVTNAGRAQEAMIEETYHVGADRVARLLLAENPPIPSDAFLAMDVYGFVIGLCKLEVGGRFEPEGKARASREYRVYVDPAQPLVVGIDREPSLTLRELTLRLYEGTFADFLRRASIAFQQKRWAEAIGFFEKAQDRVSQDQPEEEDVARATTDLRESYLEESHRLVVAGRTAEAVGLLEAALNRYGSDAALLLTLGEARMIQREWGAAIAALARARELEPSKNVDSLLEKAYFELAGEAAQSGNPRAQEMHLVEGVRELPASGSLHIELGKLYARFEAYDEAIRLLQRAGELDSALRDTAQALLDKIDDALKRRDAVVVPIPPGSRSIRTEAILDGTNSYSFIVDTGATFTAIPSKLAESLDYDISSPRVDLVPIQAVGGSFLVPKIRLRSLSLGGYVVRNLEVIVLSNDKLPGQGEGLIGLNFLKHFKYTVDATRNEFRLERP